MFKRVPGWLYFCFLLLQPVACLMEFFFQGENLLLQAVTGRNGMNIAILIGYFQSCLSGFCRISCTCREVTEVVRRDCQFRQARSDCREGNGNLSVPCKTVGLTCGSIFFCSPARQDEQGNQNKTCTLPYV